jgi:hypothetical protein
LRLNYDSVKPVLIKGKWYHNDVSPGQQSTTLVQDECGVQRVLARKFLNDHLERHEPFIFPEQCNQVFLIPDRLHENWQLVVDTEVRRTRPILQRPLQEVLVSSDTSPAAGGENVQEGPSVRSDSEDDAHCTGTKYSRQRCVSRGDIDL